MRKTTLGQGLAVSAMGLGCMGMSEFYSGRRRRPRSAARTPCIPSARCRPSTPCGAASPRARSCPPEENAAAADIAPTAEDLRRIDEVAPCGVAVGERYPDAAMRSING